MPPAEAVRFGVPLYGAPAISCAQKGMQRLTRILVVDRPAEAGPLARTLCAAGYRDRDVHAPRRRQPGRRRRSDQISLCSRCASGDRTTVWLWPAGF